MDSGTRPIESQEAPGPRIKGVLVANGDFQEGGRIRNSLEACGYDVSVWTNATDARERLNARSFELLVVSTNLGKKDMDALLEDLRPKPITPKVVLIADEGDEGDAASRAFLRTVVVMNRPFQLLELAEIVQRLIGPP